MVNQQSSPINMNAIFQIESSGMPLAHNKSTDARGLGQITPIALQDYNDHNPTNKFGANELWNPDVNYQVSNWTYNSRIPQMLRIYRIPDTTENRIYAYHDGIGNLKKGNISPEAQDYVAKYNTLNQPQGGQNGQ